MSPTPSDTIRALLHPFAAGLLERAAPAFCLRAEADPALAQWPGLICEQGFKPHYDALAAQGRAVTPRLEGQGFAVGLVALTKHKAENRANLGRAWQALAEGGLLVAAGAKDAGAAAMAKAVEQAAGLDGSLSKHHCKLFWTRKQGAGLDQWAAEAGLRQVAGTGAWSCPGLFNWDKVDPGSALLADHLPADLAGDVADFGAGWGYLSRRMLAGRPGIARLDLYEAEALAVEAARANLSGDPRARFHWWDLAGAPPAHAPAVAYDWVVSNPPFHVGKRTDIDLGRAFIINAAKVLKPGGRLLFVANRHLAYEATVDAHFAARQVVAENGAFKVILAKRPGLA